MECISPEAFAFARSTNGMASESTPVSGHSTSDELEIWSHYSYSFSPSSNALASFRSAVSKPSLNQPYI
jgi:hypothetical protein